MGMTAWVAPLIDFAFPARCPLCGAGLASQDGLCQACWGALEFPGEPACAACQRPFSQQLPAGSLCAPCLERPPRHSGIAAATLYNDTSRRLVLNFKHGRRVALAPLLGRLMTNRLGHVDEGWMIVPVPLHRWRLWQRGFNQAALLAREIARRRNATLLVDALVRRRRTPSLGGLGRKARARAVAGAITLDPRRAAAIAGANVVLVDDVLTSGATSEVCVAALLRGGANRVVIACFARVLNDAG